MDDRIYRQQVKPKANRQAVVQGEKYRFTVLTDYLIRMEYQEDGAFVDEPTQIVLCRDFTVPDFRVTDKADKLEIVTKALHLYYDKKAFSQEGLFIGLKEGYTVGDSVWNYGDEIDDLRGTARTLDNADGAVELDAGLLSRGGYTVLDDSGSAILQDDNWIAEREKEEADLYFFGYGHNYQQCLKDFYRLCGAVPLLPRYVLGNWWSRFYPYGEEDYLALMRRFEEKELPFSVSVLDMDWHMTDVPKEYGSGWTGYTWNKKLFPDPERFLQKLHAMGKRVTLNLHPADGVRAFEEAYLPMAKELGIDYEHGEKVPFDVTDRKYMKAYFSYLHHPYERMGVDFWWIDWQQGNQSRTKGVDPLWMLNHLHFMDSAGQGKRPLTFSRYAGLGSHRYPIGFSGDSVSSWESLRFQPYFTANASNAGYTWWSHDIGGHQKGRRDDELIVRWIQFGVFSPIMRLHSTANAFYGKEPWNYNIIAEKIITSFLQLRHRLIPYLYTMNYRTHLEGVPLLSPMYYRHDVPPAYTVPNEYYFGDMIVCPVTQPADVDTGLAETAAWIPEGTYFDFFTGQVYRGNCKVLLYRSLDTIPVLAPAGSIIPMTEDFAHSSGENPKELALRVFNGADGSFALYEDDCSERPEPEPVITTFTFRAGREAVFSMEVSGNPAGVIPRDRSYCIRIQGISTVENVVAEEKEGRPLQAKWTYNAEKKEAVIHIAGIELGRFTLRAVCAAASVAAPDKKERVKELLNRAQIDYDCKENIFNVICREKEIGRIIVQLQALKLKDHLLGAIMEQLASDI